MTAVPRCAEIARAGGYRPAGSAASAPIFLLVEVPLPWPSEVTQHPLVQPLASIAAAHQARVQALVPDPLVAATPEGMTRVVAYRRPKGPFHQFARDEHLVPTAHLAGAAERLLAGSPDVGGPAALGRGSRPDGLHDPGQDPPSPVDDVLVCTHGRRDVCCGGDGFRMHRDLTASASPLPGVRVWRTSHTGGHRFAPTALTFPDGRAWASVDATTLAAIVTRSLEPAVAVAHDRGCAAFADPFAQAADGAVLEAEGWRWLDMARTAHIDVLADHRRAVTLTTHADGGTEIAGSAGTRARAAGAEDADGSSRPDRAAADGREPLTYRAEVVVRRVVPVPDCGRPIEEARKSSQDLEVVSLTRA